MLLSTQRNREYGIPPYNTVRTFLGFPKKTTFLEITSNPKKAQALSVSPSAFIHLSSLKNNYIISPSYCNLFERIKDVYGGDVDKVELYVGGFFEEHLPKSNLGETFDALLLQLFSDIRNGDRFWYENIFPPADIEKIYATTLADIISRVTTIPRAELPQNVFFKPARQLNNLSK